MLVAKCSLGSSSCCTLDTSLCGVVKEGELPSEMMPKHNDDPFSDDEEEQEEQKAPRISKLLLPAEAAAIRMPLKLTSSLTGKLLILLQVGYESHDVNIKVLQDDDWLTEMLARPTCYT